MTSLCKTKLRTFSICANIFLIFQCLSFIYFCTFVINQSTERTISESFFLSVSWHLGRVLSTCAAFIVPKLPGGKCSSADQDDFDRRAGTFSFLSAASHTDCSSLALTEETQRDVKSHPEPWRILARGACARTDAHGQLRTLADVRESKHVSPSSASAFASSTCTHQPSEVPQTHGLKS